LWWDKKAFREAEPIARFGNLFVFRGTFDIRSMRAQSLEYKASFQIYGPEPNIEKAIEMLSEAAEIDPKAFFVALELGNQYLKLGKKEEALRAYQTALDNCPRSDGNSVLLERQIERLNREPLDQITPLRNPWIE
jgi:tetratricopeptide (TPR) repeat protein